MKIAVTYENGQVFQHFGHTESFKVYEVEDGKVVSSQVIGSEGAGHEQLAGFLSNSNVDVIICGGIGGGAQAALEAAGIELCAGASGDADAAVEAYLAGELENTGANCDHHDHGEGGCSCHDHDDYEEECGCGCHDHEYEDICGCDDDDCGGQCGSCHGCYEPDFEGPNIGKLCRVHYKGTFNDGTQFDSSYDRGEPMEFICGIGRMIRGFDAAVAAMNVGDSVDVHLMPEDAYGPADPSAIFTFPMSDLPGIEEIPVGDSVYLYDAMNNPVKVKIVAKDDVNVTFDANHEMAGKELNFHIELVEVKDAE